MRKTQLVTDRELKILETYGLGAKRASGRFRMT